MAFDNTQLYCVAQVGAVSIWSYEGVDAAATVIAGTYIPDGYGINVGDLLIVTEYTSTAKTAITAKTFHAVSAVASTGVTAASALAGGGAFSLLSGSASPDAALDVADSALVGTIYVETDVDEPYVCVDNSTAAAIWQSVANDTVLQFTSATLTSAGQTLARLVAPFTGRITAFRSIVTTVATGASDKLVRLVVSGSTVTSGTITWGQGDAIGTVYAATPSTANTIAAGNQVTIQSGAQKTATGVMNFFVVCRKMTTA
ncbi:MAG TPA: hypothetical protein VJ998_06310 [Pseudomonadales bacterium]|nr:hypothetical protein [Pseudomonadales bacterium]